MHGKVGVGFGVGILFLGRDGQAGEGVFELVGDGSVHCGSDVLAEQETYVGSCMLD